jgi:hypothetical protein
MVQRHPTVGIRHALSICLVLPACFQPHYDRPACGPGGQCPDGLTCRGQVCESGSAPDASIDASVDGDPDDPDAAPDAGFCFGSFARICLQSMPSAPLVINTTTTIDTGNSPLCAAMAGGPDVCVLAATTTAIEATLRATGPKPLVLLASDTVTITVTGSIDVASHRGATPETGAGADFGGCPAGVAPGLRAGGAGGSFMGPGGNGGVGGNGGNGGVRGPAIAGPLTELRGGCPGQDGDGTNRGSRGHGGGAVLLIAGNAIAHAGAVTAAGEGGGAGTIDSSGAGGGGAGGMIVLDAATITGSGLLLANGGGGGEGSGQSSPGQLGADPTGTGAASGGQAGSIHGGDGGNGSAGPAGGGGDDGENGSPGTQPGGGGGGGGGAGIIRARTGQDLGPSVSPVPTAF